MLTDYQKERIATAIAKGHYLMAGDAMTAVMKPTELVLNGDFETSAGWDTNFGWTYSSVDKNCTHISGNIAALSYLAVEIKAGGVYTVEFTCSNVTTGGVTPWVGGVAGATSVVSGTYTQEITATGAGPLEFIPSASFTGSVDAVSCVLKQKPLISVAWDLDAGSKFAEGLQIDNAGALLHGAREVMFLSSYLDAQGIDIHEVNYWLINGERWDFIVDAPLLTNIVPLAGIHNLITLYVRKAIELEQTEAVSGVFTFE